MRCLRYIALATFSLTATLASNAPPADVQSQNFPSLLDAELGDLAAGLEAGTFTSVDLVHAYNARIQEVHSTLHAVTELNPDAVSIAQDADARRAQGTLLSPLHGIPVLIKNNIGTADKTTNTAGSWALVGSKLPHDSTMAAKLRAAGVVILGRVNLSQWANFRSRNSSNGWSAHGGQTFAAYYPGQDPSGSSSGSGVASSLGLAWATLGTETSGSILAPSEMNNLVGIKPTVGLTSRYLVIPISEHQDTIGPMARTVKDAAYLLQAVAGVDEKDNYTSAMPFKEGAMPDYVDACDYDAFKGKRIGVARNVLELWKDVCEQPVLDAFEEALKEIEKAGATIVEANYTAIEAWAKHPWRLVANADFLTGLEKYLAALTHNPNEIKNLSDLQNFTHSNKAEEWPDRNTELWEAALEQGWNNTAPQFWKAYQDGLYYGDEGGVLGALERNNVDAILLPTAVSSPIPALVGSPVITVPMGFYPSDWPVTMNTRRDLIAGGPNFAIGLSFMGPKWSEAQLIGFAYAYEQRTLFRGKVQPYLKPNVELGDVIGKGALDEAGLEAVREKIVSKEEWDERCKKVGDWPRVMHEEGVPTKKNWWSEMLKSEEELTEEEAETEAAVKVEL